MRRIKTVRRINAIEQTGGKPALPGAGAEEFILLVITPAHTLPGEQALVRALFRAGLKRLHLRKPHMNAEALSTYLDSFSPAERSRIRVHSTHLSLLQKGIAGLHLPFPALNNRPPGQSVSTSIHSWKEYMRLKNGIEYVLISPVYNSLSKPGYLKNSEVWDLPRVQHVPVIALGGIGSGNIAGIVKAGFSGGALLGSLWQRPENAVQTFTEIRNKVSSLFHGS